MKTLQKITREVQAWKEKKYRVIGTVANMFAPKNLGLLVKVAAQLVEADNKYHFVIVGDGPERQKIEKEIKSQNLNDFFTLTGQQDNCWLLIKQFDVFVLCSSKEGFPYILLEAGLAKVPIVASNVGGISELIIDKQTGHLCDDLETDTFMKKIKLSLENPNKTRQMTERLYQKIKKDFSMERMMREYEKEYGI
ncbi:MAG TPA: glycosyltransferase [bacterium]|nr:glycosyltransferase [bacterium]